MGQKLKKKKGKGENKSRAFVVGVLVGVVPIKRAKLVWERAWECFPVCSGGSDGGCSSGGIIVWFGRCR